MTGVPDNKDHHVFGADKGNQIWIGEYPSPLCHDSFMASLGWLEKRAERVSNILIIYI